MHTGYEKEVANPKQEAQQLLKTSVRIDNLFPHERDCRNGKTIARTPDWTRRGQERYLRCNLTDIRAICGR